jgi:hypothetical protein
MKKTSSVLVTMLTMLVSFVLTGVSYACTLGATDCRPSSEGSSTCYKWACETCGSETCWIYKGTTCTCPTSKNDFDKSKMVCKYQPMSQSVDKDLVRKSDNKE